MKHTITIELDEGDVRVWASTNKWRTDTQIMRTRNAIIDACRDIVANLPEPLKAGQRAMTVGRTPVVIDYIKDDGTAMVTYETGGSWVTNVAYLRPAT